LIQCILLKISNKQRKSKTKLSMLDFFLDV